MRYRSPMHDDEYRRLHAACLAMAAQSTDADVRARWLAMADAWLKRVTEQQNPYRVAKHQPWAHTGHGARTCSGTTKRALTVSSALLAYRTFPPRSSPGRLV